MRFDPENFPHCVPVWVLTINHGQLGNINTYVCSTYRLALMRLGQYVEHNWPEEIDDAAATTEALVDRYFNIEDEFWSILQYTVQSMHSPNWPSQNCSLERGSMGLMERRV